MTSALVPLARRSGMDAVASAYDSGLNTPVLFPDDALIALAVSTREHWLQRPMTPVERAAIEYQEMVRQQKEVWHQAYLAERNGIDA